MGLFGKILGGKGSDNAGLNPREAFASILLLTVAGDGHISNEEAQGFNAVVNRMQLFHDQSASEFSGMMDKLTGFLNKHGLDALLNKASAALPSELHETAFAVATDLVFADGFVEDDEKEILERIQTALEIREDLAIKIIEVLMIKNRG